MTGAERITAAAERAGMEPEAFATAVMDLVNGERAAAALDAQAQAPEGERLTKMERRAKDADRLEAALAQAQEQNGQKDERIGELERTVERLFQAKQADARRRSGDQRRRRQGS